MIDACGEAAFPLAMAQTGHRSGRNWTTVHIFISSTFNDMHAERDYLVKQVFPRLVEWGEQRKLRIVDVDLRWGVTEADAQNRRVVETCLRRIDECRPFFVCLLGQRYGWSPGLGDVPEETLRRFPGLDRDVAAGASVTELEILHALVRPFQGAEPSETCRPVEHAFFYLRDDAYLSDIPADPPQRRRTYSDEAEPDASLRMALIEKRHRLLGITLPAAQRPMRVYTAMWSPTLRTPELALPLQCPASSPENQERWRRQWRDAGIQVAGLDVDEDSTEAARARPYNELLTAGRLVDFSCEGVPLGDVILADLMAAITARHPDHVQQAGPEDPLQRELEQQDAFVSAAREGFVGRPGDFDELDRYVDGDDRRFFALTAQAGMGKSTLLADWVEQMRGRLLPSGTLCFRFVGASDESTTVATLVRSILVEVKARTGKLEDAVPDDPQRLRNVWIDLLGKAGAHGKVVIVLDALNQLESGLQDVDWLPWELPPGVKLVVSFKHDDTPGRELRDRLGASGKVKVAEVRPFAPTDRLQVARGYLARYLKELDSRHLQALVACPGAENPLYLKVVLSELRVFGAFNQLGERIRNDFGETPVSAFAAVLKRMETDPIAGAVAPESAVPYIFGLLAHARCGLAVAELAEMLRHNFGLAEEHTLEIREVVELLLRQVRPFLSRRGGRWDFFYDSFTTASRDRYCTEAHNRQYWHSALADHFERGVAGSVENARRRGLSELPFHLAHSRQHESLIQTLTAHRFVRGKVATLGVRQALDDYELACSPEVGLLEAPLGVLSTLRQFLWLSTAQLDADPGQLASQLWGRLAHAGPAEVVQLLADAAADASGPWLRPLHPSLATAGGALTRTLDGPDAAVTSLASSSDGARVLSGAVDHTVRLWEVERGFARFILHGHEAPVTAVAMTPDGRRGLSGDLRGIMSLWDLGNGLLVHSVEADRGALVGVALDAPGTMAISVDTCSVRAWRILEGRLVPVAGPVALFAPTDLVSRVVCAAFDRDCRHVLVGCYGPQARAGGEHHSSMRLYRLRDEGEEAQAQAPFSGLFGALRELLHLRIPPALRLSWRLRLGTEQIMGVALSSDARFGAAYSSRDLTAYDVAKKRPLRRFTAYLPGLTTVVLGASSTPLTGSTESTVDLWDPTAETDGRSTRRKVGAHGHEITSLAISDDGRYVFSGSKVGGLKRWRLDRVSEAAERRAHSAAVDGLALSDDGQHAVSVGADGAVKRWDIDRNACLNAWDLTHFRGFGPGGYSLMPLPCEAETEQTSCSSLTFGGLACSTDGARACVATRGNDVPVALIDLASGEAVRTFTPPPAPHVPSRDRVGVRGVAVVADGESVVALSLADGIARKWDVRSGRELSSLRIPALFIVAAAVSRDGSTMAVGNRDTVFVGDLNGGEASVTIQIGCDQGPGERPDPAGPGYMLAPSLVTSVNGARRLGHTLSCLAMTTDGSQLAIGTREGPVLLVDAASGRMRSIFEGHRARVSAAAFLSNGTALVTGSDDRDVLLWTLGSVTVAARFGADAEITCCASARSAPVIAAGEASGRVHFLRLEGG